MHKIYKDLLNCKATFFSNASASNDDNIANLESLLNIHNQGGLPDIFSQDSSLGE